MKLIFLIGALCGFQSAINCASIKDFNNVMTNVLEASIQKIAESGKLTNITFNDHVEQALKKYRETLENAKSDIARLEAENPGKVSCIQEWKESIDKINERDSIQKMVVNFQILANAFQMYENAVGYLSLTYDIKQNMKITSAANTVENKLFSELVKKCFDFYYQIVKLRNTLTETGDEAKKTLDKLIDAEVKFLEQAKVEAENCLN